MKPPKRLIIIAYFYLQVAKSVKSGLQIACKLWPKGLILIQGFVKFNKGKVLAHNVTVFLLNNRISCVI